MTTPWLLRIAAIISLAYTAGHTIGGLSHWSPVDDNPVLRAMTDVHFDVMGASRSYLDLYMGLGWTISVLMLMETFVLWQLASLAKTDAPRVRSIIAVIALANVGMGLIAARFIFVVPTLFSVVLSVSLALAWVSARPSSIPGAS